MRTARYVPSIVVSESLGSLVTWLQKEFRSVAQGISASTDLDMTNVEPKTALRGMIRYASGAPGWDPGEGEGFYGYAGTPPAWKKLHI